MYKPHRRDNPYYLVDVISVLKVPQPFILCWFGSGSTFCSHLQWKNWFPICQLYLFSICGFFRTQSQDISFHLIIMFQTGDGAPTSLLIPLDKGVRDESFKPNSFGTVSWAPPQPNWNPWSSCNIDDGPLAVVSWRHNLLISYYWFCIIFILVH